MFEVNPIFKLNARLSEIEDRLNHHPSEESLQSISLQIDEVALSLRNMKGRSLSLEEEMILTEKKAQLQTLSGRCQNLERSLALSKVLDAKVDAVRKANLSQFETKYNVTIEERLAIQRQCKTTPITPSTPSAFNEITDRVYQLAIHFYRNDKGSFLQGMNTLSETHRKQLLWHIEKCGGSLDDPNGAIHVMRALIAYAENPTYPIYPSEEEASQVMEDLDMIYPS